MKSQLKETQQPTKYPKNKTSHKRVYKKEPIKKEQFKPDCSELNMSLKEAYDQVVIEQRKISVAMKELLPKDILIINDCLPYTNRNKYKQELSQ